MIFRFIVFVLGLMGSVSAASTPAVRIAVVSDGEEKDLASLVMAELSSIPAVTLVERDDLAKIGDEAKVQQLAGSDGTALGKLVGADGLIFLDHPPDGAHVRLTAVNLGYALFDGGVPETPNPTALAKALGHLVVEAASKLKLTPEQAIPISVLNLRADYPTDKSSRLERDLTLLLESRLASIPNYVLLERRHGESLGWERSLSTGVAPLLKGAYLIDGSLDFTLGGSDVDAISVHLRVRRPGGNGLTDDIKGSTQNLNDVVEQVTIAIQRIIGTKEPASTWHPEQEAREYLQEAVWAWQHAADQECQEALESAELLGETAPDTKALHVLLLQKRAWKGVERNNNENGPLPDGEPNLNERTSIALEAIRETIQYRDQHLDDHLQILTPRTDLTVRAWDMQEDTAFLASKLLAYLDDAKSPRADELRQALRKLTGYDPNHGELGANFRASPWIQRDVFADEWASSLDEELSFYRLECTKSNQFIPAWIISGQGEKFCERFLQNPEAQKKAFAQFVDSLKSDPAGRLSAGLIDSCSSDSVTAGSGYDSFIEELWNRRDTLFDGKGMRMEWALARPVPEDLRRLHAEKAVPLLHEFLRRVTDLEQQPDALDLLWKPQGWSDADAPAIWEDYLKFKQRITENWLAHGRNEEALTPELEACEDAFREKFPAIAKPKSVADAPLVVHRFWDPGQVSGEPKDRWTMPDFQVDDDGNPVVLGRYEANLQDSKIFTVQLPGFQTQALLVPGANNARSMRVSSDACFVEYYGRDNPNQVLGRFDRTRGTWEEHDMKTTFADTGLYVCNGQIYLSMRDGGLVRYDWTTDGVTLLTSPRRKPSLNQFDDKPEGRAGPVFAGPGNKPCALVDDGVYYVRDQPGDWQPVFDSAFLLQARVVGNQTFVWNQDGEVVLLDSSQSAPRYLMTPAQPHYRKVSPGQKPVPSMASWANQAPWDAPDHGGLRDNGTRECSLGVHGNNMYVLITPATKDDPIELLVYTPEARKPHQIPLRFDLDESSRVRLKPIYNSAQGPAAEWTLDRIEHPGWPFFNLKMVAAEQGLCLVSYVGGFWFIPYADVDASVASHPVVVESSIQSK